MVGKKVGKELKNLATTGWPGGGGGDLTVPYRPQWYKALQYMCMYPQIQLVISILYGEVVIKAWTALIDLPQLNITHLCMPDYMQISVSQSAPRLLHQAA